MTGISFTDEFDRAKTLPEGWQIGGQMPTDGCRIDGQMPKTTEGMPTFERFGSTARSAVCVTVNGVLYRSDEVEVDAGEVVTVHFAVGVPVVAIVSGEDGEEKRRYTMRPVEGGTP